MSRYSFGYAYGDPEGYGELGQEASAVAELLGPLAQIGASIGVATQKASVNKARIKAGKQPCTGQHGQPLDCPSMFAPPPVTTTTTTSSDTTTTVVEEKSSKTMYIVLGLLAAGGLAFFFLMSKNKAA